MLVFVFILPLLAALLCLALNQVLPTRWLGVGTGAGVIACGIALLVAYLRGGLPIAFLQVPWLALDTFSLNINLVFDQLNWALALLVLIGGGVALLALALSLPLTVRGFGGLFASSTMTLLAVVAGLADTSAQLLPFFWSSAALLIFLALRSSGALAGSDAPVIVLLAGLWGALLVLGAELLNGAALPNAPLAQILLVFWTLLGLLALGGPPFHSVFQEYAQAPAALVGALLPIGLPLLGGEALIRFFATQGAAISSRSHNVMLALGLLMVLACAAGAAGEMRLRRLIGWQLSAQMGLVLIALGQGASAIASALLANAALSALVCYLAVAMLERRAGTDHLAEIAPREPLVLPGFAFLIAAAAAVGLPGTSGFWPRLWLFDAMQTTPWMLAPLLGGSALLALTYLAPLASFWRTAPVPVDQESTTHSARHSVGENLLVCAIAVLLLVFGVIPQLVWNGWLAALSPATGNAPMLPGLIAQVLCGVAALGLIALPMLATRATRTAAPDAIRQGVFAPQALGESVRWLAWVAAPAGAFTWLWNGLLWISRMLRLVLNLFEQRYYLAGLIIAVIVVVMLFIQ